MAYEEGSTVSSEEQSSPSLLPEVGNLTLKEGEKIHIDLKGKSTKLKDAKPPAKGSSGSSSGGALPLLKKPHCSLQFQQLKNKKSRQLVELI
jgi:hypothetical protein